jgi:hypothetical protein
MPRVPFCSRLITTRKNNEIVHNKPALECPCIQQRKRVLTRQTSQRSKLPTCLAASFSFLVRIVTSILLVFTWSLGRNYRSTILQYTAEFKNKPDGSALNDIRDFHSPNTHRLRLRLDWSNLQPKSELASRMVTHQKNCSAPMGTFLYRNRFGLGSDLHVWGQALCNGMQLGMRLRTIGDWTWMDDHHCSDKQSPMLCYFGSSELNCPGDSDEVIAQPGFDLKRNLSRPSGLVKDFCEPIYQGIDRSQVRISAMEYLFLHVDPIVIQEAQRQLNLVFRGLNEVPKDLITVHIRWGDKEREMKLVEIHEYISAIRQILERRQSPRGVKSGTETANIYLATEDPEAVQQFRESMPNEWNLYVEQAYSELLPHRVVEYNGSPKMSKAVHGRAGLITLGSLLVAMEANDFVLTTASNWSRVMNELRKAILDPRCGDCTTMKDLRKVRNEW